MNGDSLGESMKRANSCMLLVRRGFVSEQVRPAVRPSPRHHVREIITLLWTHLAKNDVHIKLIVTWSGSSAPSGTPAPSKKHPKKKKADHSSSGISEGAELPLELTMDLMCTQFQVAP